ncbi:glycosyltransferase [uncultured Parabacteroides sp.]|uniref:glycosyltransferase n=2 Tax=uncultured Parabacteroides sp. TaxID=512312 RepID=UPI0026120054|nr:glycosyltransferase [uncultured Parabacteroides sp.]
MNKLLSFLVKQFVKLYCFFKPLFEMVCTLYNPPPLIVNAKVIPVIINNRNRLTCLKQLIMSLEKRGYTNIYILDNASTYPPLLEYYAKECSYKVYRFDRNYGHLALWSSGVIKDFRKSYFVYTDPDVVPIDDCPDDFIEKFLEIMKKNPLLEKVGFALKIDDLPDCFDKKESVVTWEEQFWKKKIGDNPPLYKAAIDTTFALYRPYYFVGGNMHSPNIRVGYPYVAMHMPWYNDSVNLNDEEIYYLEHCETASYWVGTSKLKK